MANYSFNHHRHYVTLGNFESDENKCRMTFPRLAFAVFRCSQFIKYDNLFKLFVIEFPCDQLVNQARFNGSLMFLQFLKPIENATHFFAQKKFSKDVFNFCYRYDKLVIEPRIIQGKIVLVISNRPRSVCSSEF